MEQERHNDESTPLLQDRGAAAGIQHSGRRLRATTPAAAAAAAALPWRPILLLLVMKICSNMFENQMATFDVKAYNPNNTTGRCEYVKQPPSSMLTVVVIAMATAAFVFPALGGALSDVFIGSAPVLCIGAVLQLIGSGLLTVIDKVGMACQMTFYIVTWLPVLLYMGFGDTLLLYAPMQFTRDARSRQFVLFLYFVAAAVGETLGNVPAALRYFTEQSFEFLGVCFAVLSLVCCIALTRSNPVTLSIIGKQRNFFFPRRSRVVKYYLIAAGAIPHLTCITLCRITLYWQQLRFFTNATGPKDFAASNVGFAGYQIATISLSICAAIAIFMRPLPTWLSLRLRLRAGLCFMAVSKVPLLVLSVLDATRVIDLSRGSFAALWSLYFVVAFCDGVTNVLATVAIYELIYCIAERSAKATFIGIFYTVWGLAILLNGAILLILQGFQVLDLDSHNRSAKPQSHYAYAVTIGLMIVSIVYWEKISLRLASGLLTDHETEEAAARSAGETGSDGSEVHLPGSIAD